MADAGAAAWDDLLDVVTDPDVLRVYASRIALDRKEPDAFYALVDVTATLQNIALGELHDPVWAARRRLTELGEVAAPLRDEGVPCG